MHSQHPVDGTCSKGGIQLIGQAQQPGDKEIFCANGSQRLAPKCVFHEAQGIAFGKHNDDFFAIMASRRASRCGSQGHLQMAAEPWIRIG